MVSTVGPIVIPTKEYFLQLLLFYVKASFMFYLHSKYNFFRQEYLTPGEM